MKVLGFLGLKVPRLLWVIVFLMSALTTQAARQESIIEAESGKLDIYFAKTSDGLISTQKYRGQSRYTLNIDVEGDYELYLKTRNKTVASKDYYKMKVTFNGAGQELKLFNSDSQSFEWQDDAKEFISLRGVKKGTATLIIQAMVAEIEVDAIKLALVRTDEPLQLADSSHDSAGDSTSGGNEAIYQPPAAVAGFDENSREGLLNHLVGFARGTTGGLDGALCVVRNTNDSGAGSLRDCAQSDSPRWVIFDVSGTISLQSPIRVGSNTTIDGRGQIIRIKNYGLQMVSEENVILHNLEITEVDDDAVKVYKSDRIWVDHLSLSNAQDGLVDITEGSRGVTVSHCFFTNHNKTMLIGANNARTTDTRIHVTIHNNHFYRTTRRNPAIRYARVHMFNNLLHEWGDGTSGDAVSATYYSKVLLENNIFLPGQNSNALRTTVGQYIQVPGFVKVLGNLVYGDAEVYDVSPEKVFDAEDIYSYQAKAASESLMDQIANRAGQQIEPRWSNDAGASAPAQQQQPVEEEPQQEEPQQEEPQQEEPAQEEEPAAPQQPVQIEAPEEDLGVCGSPCVRTARQFDLLGMEMHQDGSFSALEGASESKATVKVTMAKGTNYKMTFDYLNMNSQKTTAYMTVNNNSSSRVQFEILGSRAEYVIPRIYLQEGENTIQIVIPESNAKLFSLKIENR